MNLKTLNFHLSEVGPGGALLSSKLFRGVAPWGDTSFVVFFSLRVVSNETLRDTRQRGGKQRRSYPLYHVIGT